MHHGIEAVKYRSRNRISRAGLICFDDLGRKAFFIYKETEMTRKLQIGVMGSAADLGYADVIEKLAYDIGGYVAKNNAILVFGAEKDTDSLSTAACRGAKAAGGLTVGITYGKDKAIWQEDADVIIPTGLDRGGGREFVLALSCDVVIAISGGSGTLTEIAVAYQANIPIVTLQGVGGWSDKLSNTFLDDRNRVKCISASSAEDAVTKAIHAATAQAEVR